MRVSFSALAHAEAALQSRTSIVHVEWSRGWNHPSIPISERRFSEFLRLPGFPRKTVLVFRRRKFEVFTQLIQASVPKSQFLGYVERRNKNQGSHGDALKLMRTSIGTIWGASGYLKIWSCV